MYSPFEPTKFVFVSHFVNYFEIFDFDLHHYFLNGNLFLFYFYLFFIYIISYIFIIQLKSSSVDVFYSIYKFIYDLVESYLGESNTDTHISDKVFPFLLYLFLFLLINNLIGLLPFQLAITSHLSTTFTCSLFIWFWVVVLGFYMNGLSFFNLILPKGIPSILVPFLIVIEFISYFFRSLSLAIRLFANIFAGHILLHVVSGFISALILSSISGFTGSCLISIVTVGILFILLCFELMVACLQCYIFLVLSLIYLRDINNLSH